MIYQTYICLDSQDHGGLSWSATSVLWRSIRCRSRSCLLRSGRGCHNRGIRRSISRIFPCTFAELLPEGKHAIFLTLCELEHCKERWDKKRLLVSRFQSARSQIPAAIYLRRTYCKSHRRSPCNSNTDQVPIHHWDKSQEEKAVHFVRRGIRSWVGPLQAYRQFHRLHCIHRQRCAASRANDQLRAPMYHLHSPQRDFLRGQIQTEWRHRCLCGFRCYLRH